MRWPALVRYCDDGRLEIDNNAAERALRGVETAKLNGIDPAGYLRDVLAHIADHPMMRIQQLLPWNWAASADLAA